MCTIVHSGSPCAMTPNLEFLQRTALASVIASSLSVWHYRFSITLTLFVLSLPEIAHFSGSPMIFILVSQYSYGILFLLSSVISVILWEAGEMNTCSHIPILHYESRWDLDRRGEGSVGGTAA